MLLEKLHVESIKVPIRQPIGYPHIVLIETIANKFNKTLLQKFFLRTFIAKFMVIAITIPFKKNSRKHMKIPPCVITRTMMI